VKKFSIYFILILFLYPILGCKKSNESSTQIDSKSYINDFELIQKNPKNNNIIRITSPKAIIDPIENDIEIIDSLIEIENKDGQIVSVISGYSSIENSLNLIKVFNNVSISLLKPKDFYIDTDSFIWNLNTSHIDLDNPLDINFESTRISSSSGDYNIETGTLYINNNILNRNILNSEGNQKYFITIISDMAKWYKSNNLLEFKSEDKQVETTIDFLTIK
tara:strand:+ start:615 stop:1274 length:660 start_codon:yes stop_codon:yes gene_type:complete